MKREEIEKLIEELRHKSGQECKYGADKCAFFDRLADQIEDNIYTYEDDSYETEEDIIDDVKETFDEVDSFYDDIDEDELDNYELR